MQDKPRAKRRVWPEWKHLRQPRLLSAQIKRDIKAHQRQQVAVRTYRDKSAVADGWLRRKILGRHWYVCQHCQWRALVSVGPAVRQLHRSQCS